MRGLRRRGADLACRALLAMLPSSLQSWGWALRCETAGIPDDTKALVFALGGLCGLLPRALASRLLFPFASLIRDWAHNGGQLGMSIRDAVMRRPHMLGVACAIGAVTLGLAYMVMAGAPMRYLAINVGAVMIGLAALGLIGRMGGVQVCSTGGTVAAMSGALLATALLGETVDEVTRWVSLGGLSIQPSLILLPVMLVSVSRACQARALIGIVVAAIAMAMQPDRAMAAMLAASVAGIALVRRDRNTAAAAAISIAGLVTTLVQPDTLSAVPYVDRVLYTSFEIHPAAGVAVLGGSMLLLMPAIVGWIRDPVNRIAYATFGVSWSVAIMAAALGNYPTPIVGYGGSAIIGYLLSLLALPRRVPVHAADSRSIAARATPALMDRNLLLGMA